MVKWYGGGNERRTAAMALVAQIMRNQEIRDAAPVEATLRDFYQELDDQRGAVPYILDRLNLAVGDQLLKNKVVLSDAANEEFEKLRELNSVRWGQR